MNKSSHSRSNRDKGEINTHEPRLKNNTGARELNSGPWGLAETNHPKCLTESQMIKVISQNFTTLKSRKGWSSIFILFPSLSQQNLLLSGNPIG